MVEIRFFFGGDEILYYLGEYRDYDKGITKMIPTNQPGFHGMSAKSLLLPLAQFYRL